MTLQPNDIDYMTEAKAAITQRTPRGGRLLLWVIVVFFVSITFWAANAPIDEVTRGEGKVIPSQQVQVVQNFEGGILSEIFIKAGDTVVKGQTLLQIDDTRFSSTLKESQIQYYALQAKVARLQAEVDGAAFRVLDKIKAKIPLIVAQEARLFASRQQALLNQVGIFKQQVIQKEQEIIELKSQAGQHQKNYLLVKKELDLTRPLVSSGAISEVEVLRLERQASELRGKKLSAVKAIPRVKSTLKEANKKLLNVRFEFKNKAQEALNKVSAELASLAEAEIALQDRVFRTAVVSPVNGTVKQVKIATIGGVIQPGMDLVEIVPSDDRLMIEVKIRPSDIGFLHPNQIAMVKFTAYDFAIYGGLEGHVVHISADTIKDEEKEESFYLVKVRTKQSYLTNQDEQLPTIPGMLASVDILTGKKTVLNYLLKPILKAKQTAMRER
jgi:membrane fusion protein, adhesin transport system